MSGGALPELKAEDRFGAEAVRDHYDRLSVHYRALWGEHIHHGYWEDGESPARAQVRLVERLASTARIPRSARVLDVGCGVGGSSLWLARNLGCSVLGLSISPVQVAMAAESARAEGLEGRARFAVFDARRLGEVDESFDAVWVIECSEHLPDKARFISDCARVLRRGGTLALCAWLRAEPLASPAAERLVAEVCRGMLCPGLASMRDYTRWMRDSGLAPREAEDITPRVKETWVCCEAILRDPLVKALAGAADERTRRFAETFTLARRAFDQGAMAYGMFAAVKP